MGPRLNRRLAPLDVRWRRGAAPGWMSDPGGRLVAVRDPRMIPGLACQEARMTRSAAREHATQPEDLSRFFLERANAGDVEGLVALYQPDAVLAFPPGQITVGRAAIREVYETLLSTRPAFTSQGERPALRNGDLALTST